MRRAESSGDERLGNAASDLRRRAEFICAEQTKSPNHAGNGAE